MLDSLTSYADEDEEDLELEYEVTYLSRGFNENGDLLSETVSSSNTPEDADTKARKLLQTNPAVLSVDVVAADDEDGLQLSYYER